MGMGGGFDPSAMAMMYQNMMKSVYFCPRLYVCLMKLVCILRYGRYG
jgi:hypothetical protein